MLTRHTYNNVVWVDLERPTQEEAQRVMEEFSLDPILVEELMVPTEKPRLDVYGDYFYMVLNFPALRHAQQSREQEIDFLVGKTFIVTVRYDASDSLHIFTKIFEVNVALQNARFGTHAGFLLYHMLKKLYEGVEQEIDTVSDALDDIESKIFSGEEREMVVALSHSGRDLLNLRQSIEPHRDIVQALEDKAKQFFGPDFAPYTHSLMNDYYRVHNHIMRQTESLRELRETNTSLVSTQQSEVTQKFAIIAFVTFPLQLVAAVFSMNTLYTPIVEWHYGFWIITGIMAAIGCSLLYYFVRKGWL